MALYKFRIIIIIIIVNVYAFTFRKHDAYNSKRTMYQQLT